jgi:hypothetical protein
MKAFRYLLPAIILASFALGSCKKSGPAEAVITVIDSTGKRVPGALVVLRQDSVINPTNGTQAMINQQGITDAAGQAFFTFQLEAVLIVEASKGTKQARDYIRLEQSKQVSKAVLIR